MTLFSRVSRPLAWSLWNKKEVKQDLNKIERFRSLLNTWLTMDIWYIPNMFNPDSHHSPPNQGCQSAANQKSCG
jgi:hypothetical protein